MQKSSMVLRGKSNSSWRNSAPPLNGKIKNPTITISFTIPPSIVLGVLLFVIVASFIALN